MYSTLESHHNIPQNDSHIICANTSAHTTQKGKNLFCSSGSTGIWQNTELTQGGYGMKNVGGIAVVKYWGDRTDHKQVYNSLKRFEVNSSDYCVSYGFIF